MQSTFSFGEASPSSRTLIFAKHHGACAGPAANTWVSLIVKWIIRDILLGYQLPYIALRPVGQRADFNELKFSIPADNRNAGAISRFDRVE